jgi:hypothetical protein
MSAIVYMESCERNRERVDRLQPVDVATILEGWALEEVESLLSSTADALDELAMQASEVALGDAVISFKRADLEAYVAERRERVSP